MMPEANPTRTCKKCGQIKGIEHFKTRKRVSLNCAECIRTTQREWGKKNRSIVVTPEHWKDLISSGGPMLLARMKTHMAVNPISGCWEWTAARSVGYGVIPVKINGRWINARVGRLMLALMGKIEMHDAGVMVCHKCDNPPCFNPEHLFSGSQSDNMSDASRKGRIRLPGMFGVNHPQAKLTADQVRHIRDTRLSHRSLAVIHKVSANSIRQIKNGRHYRDVV